FRRFPYLTPVDVAKESSCLETSLRPFIRRMDVVFTHDVHMQQINVEPWSPPKNSSMKAIVLPVIFGTNSLTAMPWA
ncbi:uncharacterized protein METZ01_LOCUS477303, partial [marine metagenome]